MARRVGRPTVYDVARRAGVSIATVSFAFKQPGRVRDSTREEVMRAARELGYVPSASARGLANGSTGALGLYAFDLLLETAKFVSQPVEVDAQEPDPRVFPLYVDEVQRGFELECWQQGMALLLSAERSSGVSVMSEVAGRVDGLAVFPGTISADELELIARSLPVVAFSRRPTEGRVHYLTIDNRGGMHLLLEHLASVHHVGTTRFVGAPALPDLAERLAGYREGLAGLGLVDEAAPIGADGDWAEELGSLVDVGALPDALLCASDQLAVSVLDVLQRRGVAVPAQVIVTGFDGILAGRVSRPSLTTVRQPLVQMGRLAVRLLTDDIRGTVVLPQSRQLDVSLVVRESCGCRTSS